MGAPQSAPQATRLSPAFLSCVMLALIPVCGCAGVLSNSLAILTDAAHLLSDVAGERPPPRACPIQPAPAWLGRQGCNPGKNSLPQVVSRGHQACGQ